MKRLLAAALIPLVALPGPALADGYCRHASYGYGYSNTCVAPYTASVNYYDPFAVIVGKAFPFYLPLGAYTSVADEARDYLKQKNAVRDGILEAQGILAQQGGTVPVPGPQPQPNPAPPGTVPPLASPPKIPAATGAKTLQGIITARCAGCHNPAKDAARVDLSGPVDSIPCAVLSWGHARVVEGSMPPTGELPQAEFDVFNAEVKKKAAAEAAKLAGKK